LLGKWKEVRCKQKQFLFSNCWQVTGEMTSAEPHTADFLL